MAYNDAMKIIAIETSTEACSAALLVDTEVSESYRVAPREHTELILPMIDSLLAEAGLERTQLDAVAFGRGPGAFTGVRIAAGVAQGIAFALDVPVTPVSTLAALAHRVWRETGHTHVMSAIDARMGEVYWGSYIIETLGKAVLLGKETVCSPDTVPIPEGERWFGAGTGWETYANALSARCTKALCGVDGQRFPHAHDVARLGATMLSSGQAVAAELALPIYLRDQVVQKKEAK